MLVTTFCQMGNILICSPTLSQKVKEGEKVSIIVYILSCALTFNTNTIQWALFLIHVISCACVRAYVRTVRSCNIYHYPKSMFRKRRKHYKYFAIFIQISGFLYPYLHCLLGHVPKWWLDLVSIFVEIILGDTGFNLRRLVVAFFVRIFA